MSENDVSIGAGCAEASAEANSPNESASESEVTIEDMRANTNPRGLESDWE